MQSADAGLTKRIIRPRLWCKTLFLPHVLIHGGLAHAGGDRLLRARSEPMNLLALVSALSRVRDPVLTPWDRLLDDETLFQAVQADWSRRFPRTPRDGRPSTPVDVSLRLLGVKHR
jgi:hypothetical protein